MSIQFLVRYLKTALLLLGTVSCDIAWCLEDVSSGDNPSFKQTDYSAWKSYADNLRGCTPGTFTVPPPDGSPETMKMQHQIIGIRDNKCITQTQVRDAANPGQSASPGILYTLNCSFEQSDLATLADNAEEISRGNVVVNLAEPAPADKIIQKFCVQSQ